MTMQLVLRSDDGREYPVQFEGQPLNIEPFDFTRVQDLLTVGAAVSGAHADAIRATAMRRRQPLLGRVSDGRPQFRAIDGDLALKA